MAEMAGGNPADGNVTAPGREHLRASHAEREQAVDRLKAAFARGRLAKGEFDARISQALGARTFGDLAAVVAGLPPEPAAATPARQPSRRRMSNAAMWAASGLITPAVLAVALGADSLPGDGGYAVVALIFAFIYFIGWLSAGTDMLWEWHSACSPAARACVRCGHTAASHRTSASCEVRAGSLNAWSRCPCAGYVPPGKSLKTVGAIMARE